MFHVEHLVVRPGLSGQILGFDPRDEGLGADLSQVRHQDAAMGLIQLRR